jgi:hypothetical protein
MCSSLGLGSAKPDNGVTAEHFFLSNSTKQNIGSSLSGQPGDLNGDGHMDLVIGAPESGAGAVFVISGPIHGIPNLDLESLDGANGVRFNGTSSQDIAGASVSFVGDVMGTALMIFSLELLRPQRMVWHKMV